MFKPVTTTSTFLMVVGGVHTKITAKQLLLSQDAASMMKYCVPDNHFLKQNDLPVSTPQPNSLEKTKAPGSTSIKHYETPSDSESEAEYVCKPKKRTSKKRRTKKHKRRCRKRLSKKALRAKRMKKRREAERKRKYRNRYKRHSRSC